MEQMEPKSYLIDMDGVLVRGEVPIEGAAEFIARLQARGCRFLNFNQQFDLHAGRLAATAAAHRA